MVFKLLFSFRFRIVDVDKCFCSFERVGKVAAED